MKNDNLRLIIVSGLSGAGKSQVMNNLEDSGYFCIDNFPPYLLTSLVEKMKNETNIYKLAVAIDIRGGHFLKDYTEAMKELDKNNTEYETIFMESSNRSIISRYKLTRRRHPLIEEAKGDIQNAIKMEREMLSSIRDKVDRIIDTTGISTSQCRKIIENIVAEQEKNNFLITIYSFGYKYGLPIDADLVMDVRFLPNPYYLEHLKFLTGEVNKVEDYVFSFDVTEEFLVKYVDLLKFLIPKYMEEGKRQLVIAIGCTGGQHRSVVISRALEKELQGDGIRTYLYHREIWRHHKGDMENVF
jgi:RNase adapter protein RapZ